MDKIKQIIREWIYIQMNKRDFKNLTEINKESLINIEQEFFNKPFINELPFQTFNTIAFIIGDYVDNGYLNTYENDIIKEVKSLMA